MAGVKYDDTARLLSHLYASGFDVPRYREADMRELVTAYLRHAARDQLIARMFALTALAEGIEHVLGIPRDPPLRKRINAAIDAWLAERGTAKTGEPEKPKPKPAPEPPKQERSKTACDAHAFGQIERAAHVLQMLTAGGVRVAKPTELNQLLGMLASSISRRGPNAHRSDYDTAAATLSALEAANLITIDTARRKRAIAILGSALAVRC